MEQVDKRKCFFSSIKAKVTLLIILSIQCVIILVILMLIRPIRMITATSTEHYILDLNKAYKMVLEKTIKEQGQTALTTQKLDVILEAVKVADVASSYAYLVDEQGRILYHPVHEKIGKITENRELKEMLEDIRSGKILSDGMMKYEHQARMKVAGYTVIEPVNWILLITADEKEILKATNDIIKETFALIIVLELVICLIGYLSACKLLKPLKALTEYIKGLAALDFRVSKAFQESTRRQDEIGVISRAVLIMIASINELYKKLKVISNSIDRGAKQLTFVTDTISNYSNDNSAATEELAASMQETVSTTEAIVEEIKGIGKQVESISEQSKRSSLLTVQIKERAEDLRHKNDERVQHIMTVYEALKMQVDHALVHMEKACKIGEMVTSVEEISRRTSLLALNASIEAARAGEAGKGFGVVAGEIGALATKSAATTQSITQMVEEIKKVISEMKDSMVSTLAFFSSDVLMLLDEMHEALINYSKDAEEIKNGNGQIATDVSSLEIEMIEITKYVEGIRENIEESAIAISSVAEKTEEIVKVMKDAGSIVETNNHNVQTLEVEMSKMTL